MQQVKRVYSVVVICGLVMGLLAQFAWKMIYFPEPLTPVVIEVTGIIVISGIAIRFILRG